MATQIRLSQLIERSANPGPVALLCVLAWIVTCDQRVTEDEKSYLVELAEGTGLFAGLSDGAVLRVLLPVETEDIEAAFNILHQNRSQLDRRLVLRMAVSVAVTDGYLTIGEKHILRLLTDVLGLASQELQDLFEKLTGQELSDPGNPSSPKWWRTKEADRNRRRQKGGKDSGSSGMTDRRAKAILGLEASPNDADIKAAYRRLAKVHHPDRYQQLGPEAVDAANATFQRIQRAYEHLTG